MGRASRICTLTVRVTNAPSARTWVAYARHQQHGERSGPWGPSAEAASPTEAAQRAIIACIHTPRCVSRQPRVSSGRGVASTINKSHGDPSRAECVPAATVQDGSQERGGESGLPADRTPTPTPGSPP